MDARTKKKLLMILFAALFVFVWLGAMFVFFPVSNPIEKIGGTGGLGVFYVSLFALGLFLLVLLFMAIRTTLKDIVKSVSDDLGVDIGQVGSDYRNMFIDSFLVAIGRKQKSSEHHDE